MAQPARGKTPTIEEEDEDVITNTTTTTESSRPQTTEIANPQTEQDDDPSSGTTESADGVAFDPHDLMTSSYTEISFDSESDAEENTEADEFERDRTPTCLTTEDSSKTGVAGSLSLPQLTSSIVSWSERAKTEYEEEFGEGSTRPNTAELPSGKYCVEEDGMVCFVADDLEEKMRVSSPSKSNSLSNPIEEARSQSATSIQLDVKLLQQMEQQTRLMNASLGDMMCHISSSTHALSKLTVECTNSYENCLNKTCEAVDGNIRSMYYLMSKVEELNRAMKPIDQITTDVQEVKRLLDLFEKVVP